MKVKATRVGEGYVLSIDGDLPHEAKEFIRAAWEARGTRDIVLSGVEFEFDDPDSTKERLARIEAKLDALTNWSPWQDGNGRLIAQAEHDEKSRRDREGWAKE